LAAPTTNPNTPNYPKFESEQANHERMSRHGKKGRWMEEEVAIGGFGVRTVTGAGGGYLGCVWLVGWG